MKERRLSTSIVRRVLAVLAIAAACTAGIVRGAGPDLSAMQQRVDRLEALEWKKDTKVEKVAAHRLVITKDDRELSESAAIGTHADVAGLAAMRHYAVSTRHAVSARNNR